MQDNIELFVRRLPHLFFILFSIPIAFYLYTGYKERKTKRFFITWPAVTSYILLGCGFILIVLSAYLSVDDILTIFRELTTLFAFIYGVFATIHDFHEKDDSTGKRVVTKVGKIGVMVLTVNILLSMSTDYVNQALANLDKNNLDSKIKILEDEYLTQTGEIRGDTALLLTNYQQYIELSHKKVGELESEIEKLRNESAVLTASLKETQGKLAQSVQETQDRKKEYGDLNSELLARTHSLSECSTKLSDTTQKLEDRQKTAASLSTDLQSRTAELASWTTKANSCGVDLASSRKSHTELSSQIQAKATELGACEGRIQESAKSTAELKKNLIDVTAAFNAKTADYAGCSTQTTELKALLSEKTKSLAEAVSLANVRGGDLRNCRAVIDKEMVGISQKLSGIEDSVRTKPAREVKETKASP
ncbi:family 2 glycosyl transferase [Leptospira fluminis]|uniref:Family 2 glycosyl transferase n=1 Tax=Leptospira fluminis TaxID=2484979 RepID=A0A4R9GT78_9LEPT|nr:family 2 glycosyl transferase [Leptospira fluminis]TGK20800.1 family 2 glycosyl transferase [Leptospira fluminis]